MCLAPCVDVCNPYLFSHIAPSVLVDEFNLSERIQKLCECSMLDVCSVYMYSADTYVKRRFLVAV